MHSPCLVTLLLPLVLHNLAKECQPSGIIINEGKCHVSQDRYSENVVLPGQRVFVNFADFLDRPVFQHRLKRFGDCFSLLHRLAEINEVGVANQRLLKVDAFVFMTSKEWGFIEIENQSRFSRSHDGSVDSPFRHYAKPQYGGFPWERRT